MRCGGHGGSVRAFCLVCEGEGGQLRIPHGPLHSIVDAAFSCFPYYLRVIKRARFMVDW